MRLRKRDTNYHTYASYLTWSATYGDEVIDGTAYVREPPSPSYSHQGMVLELGHQLVGALKGKSCRAFIAPFDVRLPKSPKRTTRLTLWCNPMCSRCSCRHTPPF